MPTREKFRWRNEDISGRRALYEYHEIIEEEQPASQRPAGREYTDGWMNKTSCYFLHLSAKRMWPEVV
jgi:hypothetical protein